jgi:hypothetical protein
MWSAFTVGFASQTLAHVPIGAIVHLSSGLYRFWWCREPHEHCGPQQPSDQRVCTVEEDHTPCEDTDGYLILKHMTDTTDRDSNTRDMAAATDTDARCSGARSSVIQSLRSVASALFVHGQDALEVFVWFITETPPVPLMSNQMLCS